MNINIITRQFDEFITNIKLYSFTFKKIKIIMINYKLVELEKKNTIYFISLI